MQSRDPVTGDLIWEGTPGSVDAAVKRARNAFSAWSETDRLPYLHAYSKQLEKHKEELALLISKEVGKPLWESRQEVQAMIGKIDISIRAHEERCGERSQGSTVTRPRPHGVVAVFGPFNFPGHLPNGHIVPALLAGNTVVFKPSERAPAVGEKLAELWDLPEGVLNVVQGGADIGKELSAHNGIDGLFFTGSAETGKKLATLFGPHPEKILALEMGGNNPLVVWNASGVEAAAYTIALSAYLTAGQRCTCARRLILKDQAIVDALIALIPRLRVGHYTEDPFMGPALLADQVVAAQIGDVLLPCTGDKLLTPGLTDVTGVPNRPDREIFGPLLQIIRVDSFEAAIAEANNTAYGLSAGLISDDEALWKQFRTEVRAGIINWNAPTTGASSAAPFGGVGISGNHHPSAYYAADYCSYPCVSTEAGRCTLPKTLNPGIDAS